MNRRNVVLLALAIFLVAGCAGDPVGRVCDLGNQTPEPSEVVVASPSLDCVTRTCLRVPLSRELPPGSSYPSGNNGLCTAECSSDEDCERVPESPCKTGFTCGVAVTVGRVGCGNFCSYKDYVVVPRTACCPAQASCGQRGQRVCTSRSRR